MTVQKTCLGDRAGVRIIEILGGSETAELTPQEQADMGHVLWSCQPCRKVLAEVLNDSPAINRKKGGCLPLQTVGPVLGLLMRLARVPVKHAAVVKHIYNCPRCTKILVVNWSISGRKPIPLRQRKVSIGEGMFTHPGGFRFGGFPW